MASPTSLTPSPSQDDAMTALGAFLQSILPANVDVTQGQVNAVAEPKNSSFVIMTPLRRTRIATNIDTYSDCSFEATFNGNTMNVSSINFGVIDIGHLLLGVNLVGVPLIQNVPLGGGPGAYTLSAAQPVTAQSAKFATGILQSMQETELVVQLDIHSADVSTAADLAQTISTLFRDDFATLFFFRAGYVGISPLYADDPKQIPFIDAEANYETRYMVEAHLQINAVVTPPQEFADEIHVTLLDVDTFPA